MKLPLGTLFASSLLLLAMAACSSGETVGDQCNRVGNALCNRASQCGISDSTCVSTFTNACCQGACGEKAISNDTDVNSCASAAGGIACDAFSSASSLQAAIPSICVGVVKRTSVPLRIESEGRSVGVQFASWGESGGE